MKVCLIALGVNLVLNLCFVWILMQLNIAATHAGLALATTVSAFVNAGLLYWGLRRDGVVTAAPGWLVFALRVLISCIAMAYLLTTLTPDLSWWLAADIMTRVGRLAVIVIGGAATYFLTLALLGLRPAHLRLSHQRVD